MRVFEFNDYRSFLSNWVSSRTARGEIARLAKAAQVNSSFISQVLSGTKSFSPEQGFSISQHLGLDEIETRYFQELIQLDRATQASYKNYIQEQLEKIKQEFQSKEGIPALHQPLDDSSRAVFYSSWHYSAIQLATGLQGAQTEAQISKLLGIEREMTREMLNFLVSCGLCKTDGVLFSIGARRTHIEKDSPLRVRHQMNWRLKAFEHISNSASAPVFFTAPMRIDEKTYQSLSLKIQKLIDEANEMVNAASDETLCCLNLDLFKL